MHLFEEYLQAHNLEALTVSIIAKVRYITVYSAMKGFPISSEHAKQIRQAVLMITNIPYMGPFVLTEPTEDTPTIPIKRFPRLNSR